MRPDYHRGLVGMTIGPYHPKHPNQSFQASVAQRKGIPRQSLPQKELRSLGNQSEKEFLLLFTPQPPQTTNYYFTHLIPY